MAIRNISGCTSAQTYTVDFVDFPIIGNNVYYLTFSCPGCSPGEEPPAGCYTVLSSGDSSSISVVSVDSFANSCPDCLAGNPTPTPTPTVTQTNTPTNTQTPTPSLSGFALTGGTTNTQGGTIVYEDCITCSGDTFTQALPHAIYSNAQGRSVVQVDSVALGGFNGLNS